MEFYNLKQSGSEVQYLLDKMKNLNVDLENINEKINNMPVVNINTNKLFDISSNINDTGIYFIKSINIDKTKIIPTTLAINSDYTIIIHLQSENVLNNIVYRSQCLITQDTNMNMVFYKRDTDSDGNWTEFINFQEIQKNEILSYLKIKNF